MRTRSRCRISPSCAPTSRGRSTSWRRLRQSERVDLARRGFWIFEMDGTLTVAVHDFDAIRAELGLEPGKPILEQLALLPEPRARELYARLDALELGLARGARGDRKSTRLNSSH